MRVVAKPLVCLGEALVDLICPDPVDSPAEATRFEVHPGGALANVAVAASRAGAPAALASACGADDRGRFLRRRLGAAGVDLGFYGELAGVPTPFAFACLDRELEPSFEIHAVGIDDAIASLAGREEEVAAAAGAVVFGSNTLAEERSRAVTRAVVGGAIERGVPILFDPNLRPGRWTAIATARESCLAFLPDATVLRCNLAEARLLAGDEGLGAAAAAA
ncbi:MAG TPA: PfkB family carbohydrate kinase, partial [Solirubrobacterales bacterium]|nr:PfkB family carbohydrate kinase [Solirubrobacterales bacterium]